MDLTDDQRATLAALREDAEAKSPHTYQRDARPVGGKEAFQAWARKLDALGAAWTDLEHETKVQFLVTVVTQWQDDGAQSLPDLSAIARQMKEGLTLPAHAVEDHPGLTAATKYLWSVWVTNKPGCVPIGRDAIGSIAAEVTPVFGLTPADAERRVENILRGWDKGKGELRDSDMPGRDTPRVHRDGVRFS